MLWVREGELMENVKPACSAALALTRADCGVTPALLPWACSWNPISSLGCGACFSSRLWKPCPPASSKMSIIPLIKPGLFSPVMTRVRRISLGSQAAVAHLFNHIRPFMLSALRLSGDRKIRKLCSVFRKERNLKYTKTQLVILNVSHTHRQVGCY